MLIMDHHEYSHAIAIFMQDQFQHTLATVTGATNIPPKPAPPAGVHQLLLDGCLFAVQVCVRAFTNPGTLLSYWKSVLCNHIFHSICRLGL